MFTWSTRPRRMVLRGLVACGILMCLAGSAGQRAMAVETFHWTTSLGVASLGSGLDEKPLLVVDLGGEVTAAPFTSPLGRLLEATTFSDPRIVTLSRQRFRVVCRQHGETPLVARKIGARAKGPVNVGQADNVVFYFCTPDARVLHLAVGFLPADELLRAAALAERLWRETQLHRDVAEQRQAVRRWHLASANGENLLSFQRLCRTERESAPSPGERDWSYVQRVVAAAKEVHAQELKIRFANHWKGVALDATIVTLGHHGEVATSFAHLVLSEVPLIELDTLHPICFEAVTGQPCLTITARRKALHRWFVDARKQRQPVMFVVADDPFAAPLVNELSELLIWQPRSRDIRDRLDAFAAAQVTPGELAALIQDAGLAPVTLSRNSLNWLLFDRDGGLVDVVVSEHGPRFVKAMELAAR